MKKKLFGAIFIAFTIICNTQEKKKGNQIFYVDFLLGGSSISEGSLNSGFALNYQKGKNLFTYRRNQSKKIEGNAFLVFWFLPLEILYTEVNSRENSFMFGRRYIKNGFSYSFSSGISFLKLNEINEITQEIFTKDTFIGVPLEFSLHWFKKNKEKIKLFSLIPVGKPTGFGVSTGFKVYATIAKKSYFGAGLTFGFGYYKNYE
jgi:hypothetical protein